MNVLELIIDEKDFQSGINAVSVVESPAIEENFVALAKHEVELKEIDTEKRILMGAALIPNKKIYRRNKEEEFYIYFSEDTVRKAMELFFKKGNQNNATKGTWMISMKVDNDEVWQDVKDGKVKGFSIEGYFADKMPDSPRQDMSKNEIINQLKDLLK